MPKQKPRPKAQPKGDIEGKGVKVDDGPIATPQGGGQKGGFWNQLAQYMKLSHNLGMSPFGWNMDANDSQEAYENSMDDMEDAGIPGQGTYVGDQSGITGMPVLGNLTPATSPYAAPGAVSQLSPAPEGSIGAEGLPWPSGAPPVASGAPGADLAMANAAPQAAPAPEAAPQAGPAAFVGAPQDQVALAQKYGSQFGVDPGLLLAIAKHETGFGTKGLGRKGLTLGYGAFDSGPSLKWAGNENQYRYGAQKLADWGAKTIQDIRAGKAAPWATDPNWEKGIQSAYQALAPQLNPAAAAKTPMGGIDDILNGIENGTIDPKILDTLGPGLEDLKKTTGQLADEAEADQKEE